MKLKKLEISNYRSIVSESIDLDTINVLHGRNGAGKSSTLGALNYVFTGDAPKTAIRHGSENMTVQVTLDNNVETTIGRTMYRPNEMTVDGKKMTEAAFKKTVENYQRQCEASGDKPVVNNGQYYPVSSIWEFLLKGTGLGRSRRGADKELEAVMPDGTTLFRRVTPSNKAFVDGRQTTSKSIESLISGLINGNAQAFKIATSSDVMLGMDSKEFGGFLMKIAPLKVDFDKMISLAGIEKKEERLLRPHFPKAGTPVTVEDVAEAHKALFLARTEIKRKLDQLEARADSFTGDLPCPDPVWAQANLDDLNRRIGEHDATLREYKIFQQQRLTRERLEQSLSLMEQKLMTMANVSAPEAGRLETLRQNQQSLDMQYETAIRQANVQESLIRQTESMLNTLETSVCPLHKDLVCKTDKTPVRESLQDSLKALSIERDSLESCVNNLRQKAAENRKEIEEFIALQRAWQEKLDLEEQIKRSKASLPVLGKEPKIPEPTDALDKEKTRYSTYLKMGTLLQEASYAGSMAKRYREEYDLYSEVLKKTNPKNGVLVKALLEYLLAPIKKYCEETAKEIYPDMEVIFDIQDDLAVYLKPHGKDVPIQMQNLSSGEKMLLAFLLMDMVSSISGTRILVFDNLEQFDEGTIENLLNMLEQDKIKERYDHIFLSVVEHPSIMQLLSQHNYNVISI